MRGNQTTTKLKHSERFVMWRTSLHEANWCNTVYAAIQLRIFSMHVQQIPEETLAHQDILLLLMGRLLFGLVETTLFIFTLKSLRRRSCALSSWSTASIPLNLLISAYIASVKKQ